MMSEEDTGDKKLLELAAKAAGFTLEDHYDDDQYYPWCAETLAFWNPLIDDGDALRLMVELGITVGTAPNPHRENKSLWVHYDLSIGGLTYQRMVDKDYDGDLCSAVRRAIVEAAAEIGWEMK